MHNNQNTKITMHATNFVAFTSSSNFFNGMSKGQVDVMHNRASSGDQFARVTRYKYFLTKCSRNVKYYHRRQEHHSKSYTKSRFCRIYLFVELFQWDDRAQKPLDMRTRITLVLPPFHFQNGGRQIKIHHVIVEAVTPLAFL